MMRMQVSLANIEYILKKVVHATILYLWLHILATSLFFLLTWSILLPSVIDVSLTFAFSVMRTGDDVLQSNKKPRNVLCNCLQFVRLRKHNKPMSQSRLISHRLCNKIVRRFPFTKSLMKVPQNANRETMVSSHESGKANAITSSGTRRIIDSFTRFTSKKYLHHDT